MDMEKSWPYLAGAGVLLVLLVLARSGGSSSSGSGLIALPTSTPATDALAMQRETDGAGLVGSLITAATALQGSVNGYRGQIGVTDAQYRGESALAAINGRTATALANVSAGRDVTINRDQTSAAVTMNRDATSAAVKMNYDNADRDITIGKANARAASNNGIFGALSSIAGAVAKVIPFL